MKTVFIKYKNDNDSFMFAKAMGAKIINLNSPDEIDNEISKLYKNNFKRIVITNEVANFSEDIIKKYNSMENISIIITSK